MGRALRPPSLRRSSFTSCAPLEPFRPRCSVCAQRFKPLPVIRRANVARPGISRPEDSCAMRIQEYVQKDRQEVFRVAHAVIVERALPADPMLLETRSKPPFQQPDRIAKRMTRFQADQEVHMVGHDDGGSYGPHTGCFPARKLILDRGRQFGMFQPTLRALEIEGEKILFARRRIPTAAQGRIPRPLG